MTRKQVTRLVREGHFGAEVGVELLYEDDGWSPYLAMEDACRLDDVRLALRNSAIATAMGLSCVYELVPVAV